MDLTGRVGGWVSLTDPAVAELTARGTDFVVCDLEHAPTTLETLTDQVRAVEAGDGTAFARVPWNDHVTIKRVLDTGVAGLVVPMVDDADEARGAVDATRYPPEGRRGIAAARASDYGRRLDEYVAAFDPTLVVQIETEAGLDSAGEIAAVEGVDALFVGPADLSAALGRFGEFESDAFRAAVEAVLDAGAAADVPVGTLGTTPEQVEALGELGFDFLVAGFDCSHLVEGTRRSVAAGREVL